MAATALAKYLDHKLARTIGILGGDVKKNGGNDSSLRILPYL